MRTNRFGTLLLLAVLLPAATCKKKDEAAAKDKAAAPDEAPQAPQTTGTAPGSSDEAAKPEPGGETSAAAETTAPPADPHMARSVDPAGKAPTPAEPAAIPGTTEVRLLEPGTPPFAPLRYRLTAGTENTLTMVQRMRMEMRVAGMALPATDSPPMRMSITFRVADVATDGSASFEFRMGRPEVLEGEGGNPAAAAGMREALGLMEGFSGRGRCTDRGVTLDTSFDLPPGMPPEMNQIFESIKQSITQLSNPFPEEPVGIGARWEVVNGIEMMGMRIRQVATYALASLEGDLGALTFEIRQSAEPGEIRMPGMPAGLGARLERFDTTGTGTLRMRLDRIVPVSSSMTMQSDMEMGMDIEGQRQSMTMKMDMGIEVTGE
jgi:hypothetical protein